MSRQRPRFLKRFRAGFGRAHAVAVVAGLVTAVLVLGWTRSQEKLIPVLVAATDVPAGSVLEAADVVSLDVPAGSPVTELLVGAADRDALAGRVAVRSITAGEPLLYSDLREPAGGLGRRAMAVPLNTAHAVGGRLVEGDRVDVLAAGDEGSVRFVAEQVPVLAVPEPDGRGLVGGGSGSWWVVLGVDDRQALEIAAVLETATVYVLRSTGAGPITTRELSSTSGMGSVPVEWATGG